MSLIAHIQTVISYLRGSETVTTHDFKLALKALVEAGMSWWVDLSERPLAMACPCDPDNNASCADFLESQARLCSTLGENAGVGGVISWNLFLPLLVKLLERFLDR